jgi:hypothetical protein
MKGTASRGLDVQCEAAFDTGSGEEYQMLKEKRNRMTQTGVLPGWVRSGAIAAK